MRIQPIFISSSASSVTLSNNKQTFKGLWGDDYQHNDWGDGYHDYITDKYYHPFKDETQKDIDKIVKEYKEYSYKSANETMSTKVIDPITIYTITNVNVEKTLPFTKMEYENYLKKYLSSEKTQFIKKILLERGLIK